MSEEGRWRNQCVEGPGRYARLAATCDAKRRLQPFEIDNWPRKLVQQVDHIANFPLMSFTMSAEVN